MQLTMMRARFRLCTLVKPRRLDFSSWCYVLHLAVITLFCRLSCLMCSCLFGCGILLVECVGAQSITRAEPQRIHHLAFDARSPPAQPFGASTVVSASQQSLALICATVPRFCYILLKVASTFSLGPFLPAPSRPS